MNVFDHRYLPRHLVVTFLAACAIAFCSVTMATEGTAPEGLSAPANSKPGPVGLRVSASAAGIRTDYLEQAIEEALGAGNIFSGIANAGAAKVEMPMIRAKGVFSAPLDDSDAPYFLSVRVVGVETPSFSIRMTVGMDAIWVLRRTADNAELLHENIHTTYTGGAFEGGIHGANRVRAAMEGAERENVRLGIEMLESLNLAQIEQEFFSQ